MPTDKKKPVAGQPGVVLANVVPLRAKPDGDAEQVTQALMGQPIIAEGGQGDWYFVQTWDTYRGWIHSSTIRLYDSLEEKAYASSGPVAVIRDLVVDVMEEPHDSADPITKVTVSTELEVADSSGNWVELNLPNGKKGYILKHQARLINKDMAQTIWLPQPAKLIETAKRFIGVPYLWGGSSPFGIDCSGFVQLVHRIHNITLLRDADIQAGDPRAMRIEKKDLRMGDLVFFGKNGNSAKDPDIAAITHIGMAINNEKFIHSGGATGVTINRFEDGAFPGRYWGARRMRFETLDPGGGVPED